MKHPFIYKDIFSHEKGNRSKGQKKLVLFFSLETYVIFIKAEKKGMNGDENLWWRK